MARDGYCGSDGRGNGDGKGCCAGCCGACWQTLQAGIAILLLVYILLMALVVFLVDLPKKLFGLLLQLGTSHFGMVVEHAYALSVCKLHVAIGRFAQYWSGRRPYHSRYADIRTELPLKAGGACFVHAVPCMTDNFCYVLVDASRSPHRGRGLATCLVDPADAMAVNEALEFLSNKFYADCGGLRLEAILCTHRHWDHAGGNADLARAAAAARADELAALEAAATSDQDAADDQCRGLRYAHPLRVYAGERERVPACSHELRHGDYFSVGELEFEVIASPGHTCGSIMYRLANTAAAQHQPGIGGSGLSAPPGGAREALFTGDTLFSGGCGAQFEGSCLDTEHCFATILASCSPGALLFPGHEYTCRLLEQRLQDAMDLWAPCESPGHFLNLCGAYYAAAHRRTVRDKVPTVPCTLAGERRVNPNFDRSLRRHVKVLVAMLETQAGLSAASSTREAAPPRPGVDTATAASGSEGRASPLLAEATAQPGASAAAAGALAATAAKGQAAPAQERASPPHPSAHQPGAAPAPGGPGGPSAGGGLVGAEQAEQQAGADERSFLLNAGSCDQSPFVFFYREDIERLRAELAAGSIHGPDAAARLAECERRIFSAPTTTGRKDTFSDEGLFPEEEEAIMQAAFKRGAPPQHAHVQEPERAPQVAAGEAAEDDSSSDEEGEGESERNCEVSWPSREQAVDALKVLGVPAEIPIGPKAPSQEGELPISLDRLQAVLARLGVAEASIRALLDLAEKDWPSAAGEPRPPGADARHHDGGSHGHVLPDASQSSSSSQRQLAAVGYGGRGSRSGSGAGDLPLRQVLQSLRPTPVRDARLWRCLRSFARRLRRCARRCGRGGRRGGGRRGGRQPATADASGSQVAEAASVDDPSSLTREETGTSAARDAEASMRAHEVHAGIERVFCEHRLDRCPLCRWSFSACGERLLPRGPLAPAAGGGSGALRVESGL